MRDQSLTIDPAQAASEGSDLHLRPRLAGQRLSDVVNEAFQLACTRNDIQTAEDLLAVMERARKREQAKLQFEHRETDPLLHLARRELQAVKAKRRRW